jgi:hypothetical protein
MSTQAQDGELQKLLATNTSEYKESEDFDLALDLYVDVVIEDRLVARMSLDYVPESEARCMRIDFAEPQEDQEGVADRWTAELRAITRIMEVARPILEAVEIKLRHAGREAWENQTNPSSELFGYQ